MGAGHGGPSGRYDAWKEEAFIAAWILAQSPLPDFSPTSSPI
jgi:oligopeptidase B